MRADRAAPGPRLSLLRATVAERRAAGGVPLRRAARLLPALLRRDGPAAALRGRPRARRDGLLAGAYDAERKEYVVRDIDAHSWVEVFFPGSAGSPVTRRRPTRRPARRPPTSPAPRSAPRATIRSRRPASRRGVRTARAPRAAAASPRTRARRCRRSCWGCSACSSSPADSLGVRRRRRTRPEDPVSGALAELQRALTRSGRPPSSQTTLEALATRWRDTPAEGYVRTLTAARFGYGDGRPTRRAARGAAARARRGRWTCRPTARLVGAPAASIVACGSGSTGAQPGGEEHEPRRASVMRHTPDVDPVRMAFGARRILGTDGRSRRLRPLSERHAAARAPRFPRRHGAARTRA